MILRWLKPWYDRAVRTHRPVAGEIAFTTGVLRARYNELGFQARAPARRLPRRVGRGRKTGRTRGPRSTGATRAARKTQPAPPAA